MIESHPSRYDDPHLTTKDHRLTRTAFPSLEPSDRSELLAAIQAGPDKGEVRRWLEESGREITDEAVQLEIKKEVRNRLGELRSVLNEAEIRFLEELESELGTAEPLVIPLRSHVNWGSSEPEEARELELTAVEGIMSFLERWYSGLSKMIRTDRRT